MAITGKKLDEKLVDYLLTTVSTYHSTEIAASVVDHYGDFQRIGRWEQEEMMDDLISKMNDLD